jgi:hypothetical protein
LGEGPDPVAEGDAAEGGEEDELEADAREFSVLAQAEKDYADTDDGENAADEAADVELEVLGEPEHAVQFRGLAGEGLTKGRGKHEDTKDTKRRKGKLNRR